MTQDELKALIDEWQLAMRRYSYLKAMREALQAGPAVAAMDKQIAEAKAEMERLQKMVLNGDAAR